MATEINSQLVEELNDLVQIHNDRIEGYERAINELNGKNMDLQSVFEKMRSTSMMHRTQLAGEIEALGGEVAEGTTFTGKIYRAWMDVKSTLTGSDRENVLENCKHGEEAAQKAYDMALSSDSTMGVDVRQMLKLQQQDLEIQQKEIIYLEDLADKMD